MFRLSRNVGADGIRLHRPAAFDIGRPVEVRFALPDEPDTTVLRAELLLSDDDDDDNGDGEQGGRELRFIDISPDQRQRLHGYVTERLGLPNRL